MLASSIATLSCNLDQFDLPRANPDLVDNADEELSRLDELITSAMSRIAAEDIDLEGHLNKAGVGVGVPNIAYRDSVMFIDRNRFDSTRHNTNQHISFTHGPHFCIGAHLARTNCRWPWPRW